MSIDIEVIKNNGQKQQLDEKKIIKFIELITKNLDCVDKDEFAQNIKSELFNGISTDKIYKAAQLAAKAKIELEPQYSYVAARCLLLSLYKEAFGHSTKEENRDSIYREKFRANTQLLIDNDRLDARLAEVYNLDNIAKLLVPERDYLFKYVGLQTLYDRYFIHLDNRRLETPQAFFMRVAMGVCLNENDSVREYWVKRIYDKISQFKFMPSTPTLFNSGTNNSQLSSCFLACIDDDLESILGSGCHAQGLLSKWAGGLAASVTRIRATNSYIKGTNGQSQGLIPFLKVYNAVTHSVNQGSKRSGSQCIYLEPWHLDIEDFIDLRKNTGDERRRCHDLHTATWYPDEFFIRVENDDWWYLFSPNEVPELINTFGPEFSLHYKKYIKLAENGKLKQFKKIKAKELFKKVLVSKMETGHPWTTFKDAANTRYANIHEGLIQSTNLCCMSADQRVVTNLGLLTVGELYELQLPVKVLGREKIENASVMFKPKENSELVKIITKQGYEHKVTSDHKVWVKDYGWKEAKDLKLGDKLLIQQLEGMWGTSSYLDESFIIGLITGDGTFGNKSAIIDIWEHDFNLLDEIEKKVANIIEKYDTILKSNNHRFYKKPKFNIHTPKHSNIKKARLSSTRLYEILSYLGYNEYNKLCVPNFIWKSNKKTVIEYLRGLYYTDGTIQAIENNQTTISLPSINKKLLLDIQIILANFGIKSGLCLLREQDNHMLPDGKGGKKEYSCQKIYRLLVNCIQGCKILDNNIKLANQKHHEQFLSNINKEGYKQKLYTSFLRLENIPSEDVYCLRVDSDEHSWTVNGLITKNTEVFLHSKPTKYKRQQIVELGETAVCSLASPNLIAHVKDGGLDLVELEDTIKVLIRHLDNVVTNNYYPTLETENSNLKHRPIGMGLMGWQDYLHSQEVSFDSLEAIKLAGEIQEFISYHAIDTSIELANERGPYKTYEGSKWSKGILPIDTYKELMDYRKEEYKVQETMDWEPIREKLKKHGIRNSCLMAIAPNACQLGTNEIFTVDGIKSIYDILQENKIDYKQIENDNIKKWVQLQEFKVPTLDGEKTCNKIWFNGKQDVYDIEFEDGKIYSFTGNHLLLVDNKNSDDFMWKRVDELDENDEIVALPT